MKDIMTQVIASLESKGFSVEVSQEGHKVSHPEAIDFGLVEVAEGVHFSVNYHTTKAVYDESQLFMSLVNALNEQARVASYHFDEREFLIVNAWYPGPFDKAVFERFFSFWREDSVEHILAYEEGARFLQ